MTFESFTDIHRDDTPLQKLALLVDTSEMLANNRVNRMEAYYRRNNADSEYYARECGHMKKREAWVFEELARDLKRLEEYDAASIGEAEKRICRMTKKELLEAVGACLRVYQAYVALQYRYDCLEASLNIIRGKNLENLKLVKAIEEQYEKAEESSHHFEFYFGADVSELDQMLAQVPQEYWL